MHNTATRDRVKQVIYKINEIPKNNRQYLYLQIKIFFAIYLIAGGVTAK